MRGCCCNMAAAPMIQGSLSSAFTPYPARHLRESSTARTEARPVRRGALVLDVLSTKRMRLFNCDDARSCLIAKNSRSEPKASAPRRLQSSHCQHFRSLLAALPN